MYLSELIRRLCTQDLVPFINQNKKKLAWIFGKTIYYDFLPDTDEIITSTGVKAVWDYYKDVKQRPDGINAIIGWINSNWSQKKEFTRGEEKEGVEGLINQFQQLLTWEAQPSIQSMDTYGLMEKAFELVRNAYHTNLANEYREIACGRKPHKYKEMGIVKEERGVAAGVRWLRAQWLRDYSDEAPVVDGILHENMQMVRDGFVERMDDSVVNSRLPLGIKHLDDCLVVGKQNLRFIGVAGMSGDGKTTLVNYIVYNWLMAGAKGLYISYEHTPQEIWDVMTYLHSSHTDYEDFRPLPPPQDWENRITNDEDTNNLNRITHDIENRINISGMLEVKDFPTRDWDTLVDYLKTNFHKNKYDFLVIDYMSRMEVGGDSRFHDKAIGELIHKAQFLTRQFDDSRGLVIMTPIQITKAAYDKAIEGKFKEGEGHLNLNCIRQHSEFIHDCDLLLSVWSDSSMKEINEMEIGCLKKRKGRQPPALRGFLNPKSGAISFNKTTNDKAQPNPDIKRVATTVTDISEVKIDELGD